MNVRGWIPALVAINDPPQTISIEDLDLDAELLWNGSGVCSDCKDEDGDDCTEIVTREKYEDQLSPEEQTAAMRDRFPPSDGDEGGQYGDLR